MAAFGLANRPVIEPNENRAAVHWNFNRDKQRFGTERFRAFLGQFGVRQEALNWPASYTTQISGGSGHLAGL